MTPATAFREKVFDASRANGLRVDYLYINPDDIPIVRSFGHEGFDRAAPGYIIREIYGWLLGAEVYLTNCVRVGYAKVFDDNKPSQEELEKADAIPWNL